MIITNRIEGIVFIRVHLGNVAGLDSSFGPVVARNSVLGHRGCAYALFQTVQRYGVWVAVSVTVHYYKPWSHSIRVGNSPDFWLSYVAILPWLCRKRRNAIFMHSSRQCKIHQTNRIVMTTSTNANEAVFSKSPDILLNNKCKRRMCYRNRRYVHAANCRCYDWCYMLWNNDAFFWTSNRRFNVVIPEGC